MKNTRLQFTNLIKQRLNRRGASVVFAIVGFMFSAMISIVVITAAFSNATRIKKLRYDEQTYLIAQSMGGLLTDALAGTTPAAASPFESSVGTGLTLSYCFADISGTPSTFFCKTVKNEYNTITAGSYTDDQKTNFFTINALDLGSKTNSGAKTAIRNTIRNMAIDISVSGTTTDRELETSIEIDKVTYDIKMTLSMRADYTINAVTEVKVNSNPYYILNMTADARTMTKTIIGTGEVTEAGGVVTKLNMIAETPYVVPETELVTVDEPTTGPVKKSVKVRQKFIMWPSNTISSIYSAPTS